MTVLLLAGTAEARHVAEGLAARGVHAVASLAGATSTPNPYPILTRSGGFGGDAAFETYLHEHHVSAVLDATHPFADQISRRAASLTAKHRLPYLQLLRPEWRAEAQDHWCHVPDLNAAAAALSDARKVFMAIGRKALPQLAGFAQVELYLRGIEAAQSPFPAESGRYIVARPPFTVASEIELFQRLEIDTLVVKNAGGNAVAKLEAARALGLKVIMIDRPVQPEGAKVATVKEMLDWVDQL